MMIVRRIPIQNVTAGDLMVHVEPWGEQYVLPKDGSLEIVFYGPAGGKPELLVGVSEVSVYAWEDCRVFVLKNNLCISQPTLGNIIDRLCASQQITKLELEPEIVKYAQYVLDKAERWDKAGREAAFVAVAKVAPLLRSQTDDAFVWKFCQTILHSRGVFLHESKTKHRELSEVLAKKTGDLFRFFSEWHKGSVQRDVLVETVTDD